METVHIHTVIGSVFGNVTQYISNGELNAQQQELNVGTEHGGGDMPVALAETEDDTGNMLPCDAAERKIAAAIAVMQEEGIFKHAYDYAWIMLVMNQNGGLPHFDSVSSYHTFLRPAQPFERREESRHGVPPAPLVDVHRHCRHQRDAPEE